MADFIPRIEFNEITFTGDTTSGNATVTTIASTTDVIVGMVITGSGIPTDTTILSKTASTVVMSANATLTASSVALTLFQRITFELPPEEDNLREIERATIRRTLSSSGVHQHQFQYTTQTIGPKFTFVSQSIIDDLRVFYEDFSLKGNSFRYFEHSDLSTSDVFFLDRHEFAPVRVIPNDSGGFIHDIRINMRRTL